MKRIVILLLLLLLAGCHRSGTWQDDPKNFERIFQVPQPRDVTVVHSRFWRSPHWTSEFEYFIQIQRNDAFKKRLFEHNKLKVPDSEHEQKRIADFFQEKPSWFLPRPLKDYDAWISSDEAHGNFRIIIDKQSGDIFLTDYQV